MREHLNVRNVNSYRNSIFNIRTFQGWFPSENGSLCGKVISWMFLAWEHLYFQCAIRRSSFKVHLTTIPVINLNNFTTIAYVFRLTMHKTKYIVEEAEKLRYKYMRDVKKKDLKWCSSHGWHSFPILCSSGAQRVRICKCFWCLMGIHYVCNASGCVGLAHETTSSLVQNYCQGRMALRTGSSRSGVTIVYRNSYIHIEKFWRRCFQNGPCSSLKDHLKSSMMPWWFLKFQ